MRLRQGRMEDVTVFSDDPVATAGRWVQAGARRLHLVDLNGAFAGTPVNGSAIRAIAAAFPELQIQVGGGIRDEVTIEQYLEMGVRYCIIGTQAVRDPRFVERACRAFPDRILVGLDAKDGWVAIQGWAEVTDQRAEELAGRFATLGIAGIIYTDIGRDGMLTGPNIAATQALASSLSIPVIASGGIGTLEDIRALVTAGGIAGAIIGRALYEGTLDLAEAQRLVDQLSETQ